MKTKNIPKEIIERIKELGVTYCLINKWPNGPINLSYFDKRDVITELYKREQSLESFVIEVSIADENMEFTLWPT